MKNWQQILLSLKMARWKAWEGFLDQFPLLSSSRLEQYKTGHLPIPPASLRLRVGEASKHIYLITGERVFRRLKNQLKKYIKLEDCQTILDWGCGCGRLIRNFPEFVNASGLHGCDIDPDAIAWLKSHFPDMSFETVAPYPPTPYQDNQFDLIYGISVFTHLTEDTQFLWLEELKRISKKDGIVAVTVHGETTTDPSLAEPLSESGIADREGDRWMFFKHFLDDGYYRLTKHRKDYVIEKWSNYFEILDFVEKGIGRQDLVIMRNSLK
jgi:ubiquinone/menaquinone biosynthesis C-methylase UbiE